MGDRGKRVSEKTYEFIQIGAGLRDDESRNRSNDALSKSPVPSSQRASPANVDVGVYGENGGDNQQTQPSVSSCSKPEVVPENEYADPDEISSFSLSLQSPKFLLESNNHTSAANNAKEPSFSFPEWTNTPPFQAGSTTKEEPRRASCDVILSTSEHQLLSKHKPLSAALSTPPPMPRERKPSEEKFEMYDSPTNFRAGGVRSIGNMFSDASKPIQPINVTGSPVRAVRKSKPTTVETFLSEIGLEQYTQQLVCSGWDRVEFLGDLSELDLKTCGIRSPHHIRAILSHVHTL